MDLKSVPELCLVLFKESSHFPQKNGTSYTPSSLQKQVGTEISSPYRASILTISNAMPKVSHLNRQRRFLLPLHGTVHTCPQHNQLDSSATTTTITSHNGSQPDNYPRPMPSHHFFADRAFLAFAFNAASFFALSTFIFSTTFGSAGMSRTGWYTSDFVVACVR